MIKKITVDKLKTGVYIHDYNHSWFSHPFLFSKSKIKTEEQLKKLKSSGIKTVYIDTTKGVDIVELPNKKEIAKLFQSEYDAIIEKMPEVKKHVSMKEELRRAKEIENEASEIVRQIDKKIRSGKQFEVKKVDKIIEKMVESISRNRDALMTLMSIREMDEFTFMHSVRVSVLVMAFCKYQEMDPEKIKLYGLGALLHDIGKLRIPIEILNKPGKLTNKEYKLMKTHPQLGEKILSNIEGIDQSIIDVVYEHHERFDGQGYPNHLQGNQISEAAQFVSIASVYDALISENAYSEAIAPTAALRAIYEMQDKAFSAELVQLFIKAMGIFPIGSLVRLYNDLLAVVVESRIKSPLQPKVRIIYDIRKNLNLAPRDVDLSRNVDASFQIRHSETPDKWNINPLLYLTAL
jgi:putative nucleotidyltransferase with HDIG domain